MTPLHAPILETRVLRWPDEAACAAWAGQLASRLVQLPPPLDMYLELQGPLGAGKTTFVRHLLRALGVQGRIKSPTYAVLEPYTVRGIEISHLDFYRFNDPHEWEDAGLRELFGRPGLKLAEWPDKAAGRLPLPDLRIGIEPVLEDASPADARAVQVQALSAAGRRLLGA